MPTSFIRVRLLDAPSATQYSILGAFECDKQYITVEGDQNIEENNKIYRGQSKKVGSKLIREGKGIEI